MQFVLLDTAEFEAPCSCSLSISSIQHASLSHACRCSAARVVEAIHLHAFALPELNAQQALTSTETKQMGSFSPARLENCTLVPALQCRSHRSRHERDSTVHDGHVSAG